jgi:hypothetical protein
MTDEYIKNISWHGIKYALRFLLAHLSMLTHSPASVVENVGANVQGNTMAPIQSAQHSGTLVGCGGQTCMHHSGGSECTWPSGHCGHTT